MSMDGLVLNAVCRELAVLQDGKIDKIQQPEKDALLFFVRCKEGTKRLLINTHAENGRMHLTLEPYDNPMQAPAFCMLLRRHLLGGRITGVLQNGPDRVCTLSIHARNELMDEVDLRLVAELTGKHGNVILVGADGKILDCLRRISPVDTTSRVMLPGFTYEPLLSQGKLNPFTAAETDFAQLYHQGVPTPRQLTEHFDGLGKSTAMALLLRCETAAQLYDLFRDFSRGKYAPCVVYDGAGEPLYALPFDPVGLGAKTESFSAMWEALDAFSRERDAVMRIRRHGSALRRTVENALSRGENKRKSFLEAIQNGEKLETFRLYGELILANLHLCKSGQSLLIAENYYQTPPEQCEVPLDPALSPGENAKKYFKQYRKGKLSRDYAEGQLETVEGEIAYLEGQLVNIGNCESLAELEEIRQELIAQKYVKPDKKRVRQQFAIVSKPMRYLSSDDIPMLVGKNNRQNDALTIKTATGENLWLHAKNTPGSHVIVQYEGTPPEQTLLEAATLAAYYSAGRSSPNVAVDYTPRKFVKKPSGARPGMVVYSTNKTLYVSPDAAAVRRLRQG